MVGIRLSDGGTCLLKNLFKVSSTQIAFGENVFVVFSFALFGGLILGTLNFFYYFFIKIFYKMCLKLDREK